MEPRKRLRCGEEMLDNCYYGLTGHAHRIVITQDVGKLFNKSLDEPNIAVCPNCGEISWYVPCPHLLKKDGPSPQDR